MCVRRRMPEMHEPGIVKRRGGLEAGDMPAEFGRRLVGAQHDGRGVPADNRANLVLEGPVAWMCRLILRRDGVHIGRVGRKGQLCTLAPGGLDNAFQQFIDPADAFKGLDGIERIEPFTCFSGIAILVQCFSPLVEMLFAPSCRQLTCDGLFGSRSAFRMPAERGTDPGAI